MIDDLEKAKTLLTRNWKKRETGLGLVRDSVLNVIGTIQMMVGKGEIHIPLLDSEVDLIEEQSSAN